MKFLLLFLLSFSYVQAQDYSIVFVHLGSSIPSYAYIAVEQARIFNEECSIYLVSNEAALKIADKDSLLKNKVILISCESLKQTDVHRSFLKKTKLDERGLNGFWRKACERFFYLEEVIKQHNLNNVFHVENDVMLYVNLGDLLPVFTSYEGVATAFDNDDRCIPSIMYINNPRALHVVTKYFVTTANKGLFDMQVIALCKKKFGKKYIDSLPIVTANFVQQNELRSATGKIAAHKQDYCNKFEQFQCIFDAAALGQYLGGIHHISGNAGPGFINESCIFSPARFEFVWEVDNKTRRIPYMTYQGIKYPIANLHIHCKNLELFRS